MKYAFVFSLLALILAGLAVLHGGWVWLLLWPSLSFAIVAAGYAGLGPRVFGKDDAGRLSWWSIVLLLPYLLLTWGLWSLTRCISREPGCHDGYRPGRCRVGRQDDGIHARPCVAC